MIRNRGCLGLFLLAVAGQGLGLGLQAHPAWADAAPAPLGSGFDTTLPPQFSGGQAQQLSNVFVSCMNSGIGQLANALKDPSHAVGITTACPNVPVPELDDLSCSMIMDNGVLNDGLVKKLQGQTSSALDALQCKQNKFQAINGELSCLSQQATALSQQVASLQAAYVQNIQRMQQDLAQLKQVEDDRNAQIKRVGEILNGNKNTGEEGVLQTAQETRAMFDAMNGEIEQFKDKQEQAVFQRKGFGEQVQARTMTLTSDCFGKQPQARFRCVPGGPPVSARDYVLCRYQQQQQVGVSGHISRDSNTEARAQAAEQGLEALLDQIFSQAPKSSRLPNSKEELQASMDQSYGVMSAADIESQYGDQLAKFNGKGLDIHGFIMAAVGQCWNRSHSEVTRELGLSSSELGAAKRQLDASDHLLATQANDLINKYADQYAKGTKALTGMNLPLDVSACRTGKPGVQASCLTQIRSSMEGLLKGTSQYSQMKMTVTGNNPKTTIVFSCTGLDGCASSLQSLARNLDTEVKRVDAFKKDYIMKANQNVEAFTNQMANALSRPRQMLQSQLGAINSALRSLGVGQGIETNPLDPEQLEKDDDGLYKVPENALKLIGGRMTPPMIDVSKDSFSGAAAGISQGLQDLSYDLARASTLDGKLKTLPKTCKETAIADRMQSIQQDLGSLSQQECDTEIRWCGMSGHDNANSLDPLASLLGVVDGLSGKDGISAVDLSMLKNGIEMGCSEEAPAYSCRDQVLHDRHLTDLPTTGDDKGDVANAIAECNRTRQKKQRSCSAIFSGIRAKVSEIGSQVEKTDGDSGETHSGSGN